MKEERQVPVDLVLASQGIIVQVVVYTHFAYLWVHSLTRKDLGLLPFASPALMRRSMLPQIVASVLPDIPAKVMVLMNLVSAKLERIDRLRIV